MIPLPAVQNPAGSLGLLLPRAAAAMAGTIALAVLVGWMLDIRPLKSVLPGLAAMQPWSATGMLLGAFALRFATCGTRVAKAVSVLAALALAVVACLPLIEDATGLAPGTDLALFTTAVLTEQPSAYSHPGRMALLTALGYETIAAALLFAHARSQAGRAVFSALATIALIPPAMGLLNYAFGIEQLAAVLQRSPIAIHTAFGIALLAGGTLALRRDAGWMRVAAEQGRIGWFTAALFGTSGLFLVFGIYAALQGGTAARVGEEAALHLERLMFALTNAVTHQRGYLLTGEDRYLAPYEAARRQVGDRLDDAMDMLGERHGIMLPAPQLERLLRLAGNMMAMLTEAVTLQRAGDVAGALALVRSGQIQTVMEATHAEIEAISTAVASDVRFAESRALTGASLACIGSLSLLMLALAALATSARSRRATRDDIAASEARLRNLVETLDLGTFITQGPDGVIRFWSKGCERLYGLATRDVVGRPGSSLFPSPWPVQIAQIRMALEQDGEWIGDVRHVTHDGRALAVAMHAVLRRDADGKPHEILTAITDVTAQRLAEATVKAQEDALRTVNQRARELESGLLHAARVSAVGEAAAVMAHEIAHPLSGAATFLHGCETLLGSGQHASQEMLKDGLHRAQDAIGRARSVVQQLRRFLRKDTGQLLPMEVNSAVHEAVELAALDFERHGGRILWDLPPALPEIIGDRTQIQQVVVNLVRNAIEAMEDAGSAVRELYVATARTESGIEITVADTGPGLPASFTTRPFSAFASNKPTGLGLGLSISRSIIDAHGGKLSFETGPQGTMFRIALPAADAAGDDAAGDDAADNDAACACGAFPAPPAQGRA
ncbi:ATP-binding protein [Rhodovastum atsumiense]|uniref:histidine kinase n=1 Tax=Rhodovastum atsumiense TaxID=504468 RepID=A0A5M6IUZ4_9PROT|nr:ATP-binding protein [Rhodovastum atsumiense]KAA5612130.1 PAS domain S-box protein [Rhodovastum atsumiense]